MQPPFPHKTLSLSQAELKTFWEQWTSTAPESVSRVRAMSLDNRRCGAQTTMLLSQEALRPHHHPSSSHATIGTQLGQLGKLELADMQIVRRPIIQRIDISPLKHTKLACSPQQESCAVLRDLPEAPIKVASMTSQLPWHPLVLKVLVFPPSLVLAAKDRYAHPDLQLPAGI